MLIPAGAAGAWRRTPWGATGAVLQIPSGMRSRASLQRLGARRSGSTRGGILLRPASSVALDSPAGGTSEKGRRASPRKAATGPLAPSAAAALAALIQQQALHSVAARRRRSDMAGERLRGTDSGQAREESNDFSDLRTGGTHVGQGMAATADVSAVGGAGRGGQQQPAGGHSPGPGSVRLSATRHRQSATPASGPVPAPSGQASFASARYRRPASAAAATATRGPQQQPPTGRSRGTARPLASFDALRACHGIVMEVGIGLIETLQARERGLSLSPHESRRKHTACYG